MTAHKKPTHVRDEQNPQVSIQLVSDTSNFDLKKIKGKLRILFCSFHMSALARLS